jgi:hypothetical protein
MTYVHSHAHFQIMDRTPNNVQTSNPQPSKHAGTPTTRFGGSKFEALTLALVENASSTSIVAYCMQ